MPNKKYDVQSLKNLVDTLEEADKNSSVLNDIAFIEDNFKRLRELSKENELSPNKIEKVEQFTNEDRQKHTFIVKKATEQAKDVREGEVTIDAKEERERE